MAKSKDKHKLPGVFMGGIGSINSFMGGDLPVIDLTETKKKSNQGVEEEQAFIIRSDEPEDVLARLASLEKSWGAKIIPGDSLKIVDTYYNTASGDFKKSSLRIRNINGKDFITIKSGKKDVWEGKKVSSVRNEFEVEWPWETPSALDVANLFELVPVQTRTTFRVVRNIMSTVDTEKINGEMALDEVTYKFPNGKKIRFYEVEVEKKRDVFSLSGFCDNLAKKFPELERWHHSKLSTGKVLELISDIEIDGTKLVTSDSFEAIGRIAEALK